MDGLNLDDLSALYKAWCKHTLGRTLSSADEHFNDPHLTPDQQGLLRRFSASWDALAFLNAGKPWTQEEDEQLLELWRDGWTVTQIAHEHRRTLLGIEARLDRHGKLYKVVYDGDSWRVLGIGARGGGKVYAHLASTTRHVEQRDGNRPVQIATWIDEALLERGSIA